MFRKILNTLMTRAIAAVASLLIAVIISQLLGAEGKGEQSLIITTIAMIMLGANLLAGAALVYLSARYPLKALLWPSAIWSLLTGLVAFAVLYLFPVVDVSFVDDVAILSVLCAFAGITANFLIGRERIPSANLVSVLQPLIILFSLGVAWYSSGGISLETYVNALYFAYSISALTGMLLLIPEWNRSIGSGGYSTAGLLKQMWHYGFLNQLSHIFQLLSFRMGYYFLDYFSGAASVGLYSNAVAMMESVWLLSKSIAVVQYGRISNSEDDTYTQRLTLELSRGVLAITLLAVAVLCLIPAELWVIVFGPEFNGLPPVMLWLAPGILFFSLALILGHYFSGNGRYQANTFASLAGLIVALAASVILIPLFGVNGAAAASSASYLVTAIWSYRIFSMDSGSSLKELIAGKKDVQRVFRLFRERRN